MLNIHKIDLKVKVGSSLQEVLRRLPQLSSAELDKVAGRLAALRGTGAVTKVEDNDWLLEGLTQELRRRGLWMRDYPVLKKLIPSNYVAASPAVRDHLLLGWGKKPIRTIEKLALAALAGGVLADYLTKIKLPVTPRTVLVNVDKVPVALEESFPGYWASGLLSYCVRLRRA